MPVFFSQNDQMPIQKGTKRLVNVWFGSLVNTLLAPRVLLHLRLPTTYDNQSLPIPSHPHIAVKTTSPPKMQSNQSNQPIDDYQ